MNHRGTEFTEFTEKNNPQIALISQMALTSPAIRHFPAGAPPVMPSLAEASHPALTATP